MPPVPPQKAEFPKFVDSLWCIYLVSVVAAWNAELVTYPLDLIKTRLQIQGEQANKTANGKLGKAPYRGMLLTAIGISREEGIRKLWQGVHAAFIRHMLYSGTRIITYKALKEKVFQPNPEEKYFPVWQSAVCGVTAGAFAQYISSPTDLLKVQLQMEGKRRLLGLPARVHGLYDAFQKVWSTGGVRGLWKGMRLIEEKLEDIDKSEEFELFYHNIITSVRYDCYLYDQIFKHSYGSVPNVQRAALVNLGDLTTYDVAKRFIMKHTNVPDNHLLHVMASSCAGLVAASMGTPADVIKTRVMNQPFDEKGRGLLYSSSIDCLKKTVKLEGVGALYKGFVPIWMRMAPWSLTFWLTYEEVVKLMGAKSW